MASQNGRPHHRADERDDETRRLPDEQRRRDSYRGREPYEPERRFERRYGDPVDDREPGGYDQLSFVPHYPRDRSRDLDRLNPDFDRMSGRDDPFPDRGGLPESDRASRYDAGERIYTQRAYTAHHAPHRARGPHRGKGPAGFHPSDERIREMVCEALTDHDEIDATHVEVGVRDGEVTLAGTVDARRTKRLAEEVTEDIRGVRDVHNQLRIATKEGP
jgi:hypothetical protein